MSEHKLSSTEIDATLKAIREYEDSSFGIMYGSDFPALGESLSQSTEFKGLCQSQFVVGALAVMTLGKDQESISKAVEQSPLRKGLLIAFYAGYKLGQRQAEICELQNLSGHREP